MSKSELLTNRNFLLLWQGQTISVLGSFISRVAIMLWVAEATGSAQAMTTMLSLAELPAILLGLLAGWVCDRFSRRAIIVWGDGLKAALSLATALFFLYRPEHTPTLLIAVYLLYIGQEAINTFFHPALRAILPDLVPMASLPAATAIEQTTTTTAYNLGMAAGGVILRLLGLPMVLLLDGVSFLVSLLAGLMLRPPPPPARPPGEGQPRRLFSDLLVGVVYVWQERDVRAMMLVFLGTTIFLSPILALLPLFVKDPRFLAAPGEWYGFLMAGIGAGGLLGHWLNVACAKSRWAHLTISLSLIGIGGNYAVLGLLHSVWLALALVTVNGVLVGMMNNQTWSLLLGRFPSHLRGRADMAITTITQCATPPTLWLSGLIADAYGKRLDLIFLVCGLMAAAVGVWAFHQPAFREFLTGSTPDRQPTNHGENTP